MLKNCKSPECTSAPDAPAIARDMCQRCYNRHYARIRTMKAQNDLMVPMHLKVKARCEHKDRAHYARGFCHTCYIRERRRAQKKGIWKPEQRYYFAGTRISKEDWDHLHAHHGREAQPQQRKPVVLEPYFGPPEEDME